MAFIEWFLHETSLYTLFAFGNRDIYLILLSRYLRMFAYGGAALVLGIFLWAGLGYRGTEIGTFLTLTLLGDAAISYLLTVNADKIGRRKVLMLGSCLMVVAGAVFSVARNWWVLLIAAILGVISPGAHEMGPFRAVQESTLAQLTPIEARTDMYAWFAVSSTLGMASGLCVSGWITYILRKAYDWNWKECYPPIFILYAVVGAVKVIVIFLMSDKVEPNYTPIPDDDDLDPETSSPLIRRRSSMSTRPTKNPRVTAAFRRVGKTVLTKLSPDSRRILIRLCLLFAINSFAQGMIPVTLMSWYVNYRYRWFILYRIGYIMAAVWIVASIANLFSASVARRLGLVKAMVFTHLPNAIFLGLIPLADGWRTMLVLLLVSAAFGSMDQAPRSAFVAAVFSPSERTAVMGTINFVRTVAAAGGPLLTGYLHDKKLWSVVYVTAAVLKVCYDIGLLAMFLKTKIPDTEHEERRVAVADVDVGILLNDVRPSDDFGEVQVETFDEEADLGERDSNDGPDKATYEGI